MSQQPLTEPPVSPPAKDLTALFPRGEGIQAQIERRRRNAKVWRFVFLTATLLAVIILTTLLLSIINQSFGLVAEQTNIPESQLVVDYHKSQMLAATNVVLSSEDDAALAEGLAADANGVGLLSFAYYAQNPDALRALSVDGVLPSAETVQAGTYPLTRPLVLYTTAAAATEKPQVGAFLAYYLQNAAEVMTDIGYFPLDAATLAEQEATLLNLLGVAELPTIAPADYEGDIVIAGSSSLNPVTREVAKRFRQAGFQGAIKITSVGTGAGFAAFCAAAGGVDVVNASRAITQLELESCRANDLNPVATLVGADALTVAVNAQNEFATDVTPAGAGALFTTAVNWADVEETWPAEALNRYIPTADSGTMDTFVATAFAGQTLADLPYDSLVALFKDNVSAGRCRAVESEQRFYADRLVCDTEEAFAARCAGANATTGCTLAPRDHAGVAALVQAEVIQPEILQAWFLAESLFNRQEITAAAQVEFPSAEIKFRRWLTWDFLTRPQSATPELAGVRTAILGSLWVVGIGILVGFPVGVGAAIYLEEYADKRKRFNSIIQTNINNLAGVPSIIYGLLGLTVFVRVLEPITSGAVFGVGDPTTANGRTILSAGLTLALLILPVIIISAQEAIKAVPSSLREASFGLGATRWQTIWNHVIPNAIGGIMTGVILAMSRIIGETAPLVVVGAATLITTDPSGPFSKFTTLPIQIYQWTARPQQTFLLIAGAAIIVLIILLFILNGFAIYLRNRYARRIG
jgi:phosphate transport system permease protein